MYDICMYVYLCRWIYGSACFWECICVNPFMNSWCACLHCTFAGSINVSHAGITVWIHIKLLVEVFDGVYAYEIIAVGRYVIIQIIVSVCVCVHMCGALVRVFAFACACVSKQRDTWINQTWVCWGYISVNTHTPPMRAHTLTFWRAQSFHGPSAYQSPWQSWHGNPESAAGRRHCCQRRQSPGHSSSTDAAKVIVRSSRRYQTNPLNSRAVEIDLWEKAFSRRTVRIFRRILQSEILSHCT